MKSLSKEEIKVAEIDSVETIQTKSKIMLLDPSVATSFPYCSNDVEDLDDMFGALKLPEKNRLILLPMNDNTNSP